jgi:hypothetical protein
MNRLNILGININTVLGYQLLRKLLGQRFNRGTFRKQGPLTLDHRRDTLGQTGPLRGRKRQPTQGQE